MMKNVCALLVTCAGLLAPQLRADFIATATMNAATDHATNSNGTGMATITYNAAAADFTYTLSWMNLTGPATMGHIHDGAPGVDGPIVVPFFMSSMPATSSMSGTLTQADVTPVNGVNTIADVAALIMAGNAYVNIHTAQYPAGEIRGQLMMTPEPGTTGLMLLSFACGGAVLWNARRRKCASVN